MAVAIAMVALVRSGARVLAISQTAKATTATATILSPRNQSSPTNSPYSAHAIGEQYEYGRRRQCETQPCRKAAEQPAARNAHGDAHLAAGRAGQELAQCDEICVRALVEPLAGCDVLLAEVAQVCDRSPEGGQAQSERDEQYFERSGEHSLRAGFHESLNGTALTTFAGTTGGCSGDAVGSRQWVEPGTRNKVLQAHLRGAHSRISRTSFRRWTSKSGTCSAFMGYLTLR